MTPVWPQQGQYQQPQQPQQQPAAAMPGGFVHQPGMTPGPGMVPMPGMMPSAMPGMGMPMGGMLPQQGPVQQAYQSQATPLTAADGELLNLTLAFDPDVDANQQMPPVLPSELLFGSLDRGYTAYAVYQNPSEPWKKDKTKAGIPYISAPLFLVIDNCQQNPSMNGRRIRFQASSLVSAYQPTCSAQKLIQAVQGGTEMLKASARTVQALKEIVDRIVASGQRFMIGVDWEGSFKHQSQKDPLKRIRSWKDFPRNQNGEPVPTMTENFGQFGVLQANAYMVPSFFTVGHKSPGQQFTPAPQAHSVPQQGVPQFAPPAQFAQTQPAAQPSMQFAPAPAATFSQPAQPQQSSPIGFDFGASPKL